ncbi:MAG: hypothetical protein IKT51_02660 [Phascolarctobacterium sp.]|nr:hypothetical protein [Phascolarctobacterium sp.]
MVIYEQDKVLCEEASNGDKTIIMPVTRANNVEGLGRIANAKYSVGDVVYIDNNQKVALKCTTAGTTSSSELDVSSIVAGNTISDGSVTWVAISRNEFVGATSNANGASGLVPAPSAGDENKVLKGDGTWGIIATLPVGHMYFSLEKTVPAGRIPAQGETYNRNLYAALWAYAQDNDLVISEAEWQAQVNANDGNCAFYSDGDGSTTFRVPSIKCWVKGAGNDEEVGGYLDEGLPDIKGAFNFHGPSNDGTGGSPAWNPSGAFYEGSTPQTVYRNGGTTNQGVPSLGTIAFAASNSNSIYGNSHTVQPKTIVGMWLIVAYGTVSNIGNADITDVMRAIQNIEATSMSIDEITTNALQSGGGEFFPAIRYKGNGDGASLWLFGKEDDYNGGFILRARNANNVATDLKGVGNGTLTWGESRVLTGKDVFVAYVDQSGASVVLPNGGTWSGFYINTVSNNNYAVSGAFSKAGGSIAFTTQASTNTCTVMAFRTA